MPVLDGTFNKQVIKIPCPKELVSERSTRVTFSTSQSGALSQLAPEIIASTAPEIRRLL